MPAPEIVYAKANQALPDSNNIRYKVFAGMPYPGDWEVVRVNPEAFSDRPVGPMWDARRIEAATRAPGERRG